MEKVKIKFKTEKADESQAFEKKFLVKDPRNEESEKEALAAAEEYALRCECPDDCLVYIACNYQSVESPPTAEEPDVHVVDRWLESYEVRVWGENLKVTES